MNPLFERANKVFLQNHGPTTWFERAIFFSWFCSTKDCKFCYMSTLNTNPKARRSRESLLAEVIVCRQLGWRIGFVSGGHDAYTTVEFEDVLRQLSTVAGEKLWINIGAISKKEMQRYAPNLRGVVASIETINPKVHELVCPSKPIAPFEEMLTAAGSLGLAKAVTLILGLGETMPDFPLLETFLRKHKVEKIHFYSLNPQKGTSFENAKRPTADYQAEWIARTRIAFPTIDIQAGIWLDCADRVGLLLTAGANSISKFPAIRHFGSEQAKMVERQAEQARRNFQGSLTRLPRADAAEFLSLAPAELQDRCRMQWERYWKSMQP